MKQVNRFRNAGRVLIFCAAALCGSQGDAAPPVVRGPLTEAIHVKIAMRRCEWISIRSKEFQDHFGRLNNYHEWFSKVPEDLRWCNAAAKRLGHSFGIICTKWGSDKGTLCESVDKSGHDESCYGCSG